MKAIGRLHVLTDIVLQSRFSHGELTRLAIAGGADAIQFRQKTGSTRSMIEAAREMKRICAEAGAVFIVNDRLDVALASDADGVHLGQDDFPISLARKILGPDRIIGGSADRLSEAEKCLVEGADYVGFGPVYPTTSKDDAGPVTGLASLRQVVQSVSLPIIAIGGVEARHAGELVNAGAHGIAVISAVCCREDPEAAARELAQAMERAL